MTYPQKPRDSPPSFWLHFTAGGLAGTVGAAVTCPLEVVKTRLQSSLYSSPVSAPVSARNPAKFVWSHMRGVVSILSDIYAREGLRALWKGLGPNLVGVVPARSIHFAVYTQSKHYLSHALKGESSVVHMLSAAGASATTTFITNPIWLVKTRMQLQRAAESTTAAPRYRNAFHCVYEIVRTEGVTALYKGYTASLLGLGESAMQFVVYEALKRKVWLVQTTADPHSFWHRPAEGYKTGAAELFACASLAKLFATLCTYPHEVLRTRLRQTPDADGRVKYHGIVQASRLMLKEEGVAAFYGGMTAHVMRVVPNAAMLFLSYESIVWYCRKYEIFA
ncbi:MAG: hypothetical protein SGCHY_004885 [Lobulomycetales sp.]